MEPSAAVSAGPSAEDLTEEGVTLESALHTEAAGLPHRAGSNANTQLGELRMPDAIYPFLGRWHI